MILPSSNTLPECSSINESNEISDQNQTEDFIQRSKIRDDELIGDTENSSSDSVSASPSDAVPLKIVWRNVILFALLHIYAVYGLYLMFTSAKWQTNVFSIVLGMMSGLGVTAGVHRLWSHRSYKAKLPLRIFLAFVFTVALQNDIYEWCRDHRVHHKYSETHADPHNAKRGFFFAHMGWLMCRKHPDVKKMGESVDCRDLLADPIVKFHRKYYIRLVLLCSFILPTLIPMYFWKETFINSLFVACFFRLGISLNETWLVNSAAHLWGDRPYDISIYPRENLAVSFGALGEGFHNYHHTFPYDYATSEHGMKCNLTTAFINLMAFLGLAYDRKTASKSCIQARKQRTGLDSLKKTEDNEDVSVKDE